MFFEEEVEAFFDKDELFSLIDHSFPFQIEKDRLVNFIHFWKSLHFAYDDETIKNFDNLKILERTLTPIKK